MGIYPAKQVRPAALLLAGPSSPSAGAEFTPSYDSDVVSSLATTKSVRSWSTLASTTNSLGIVQMSLET